MSLYIKPPSGAVSFNKLHNYVMKRFAFLYYINDHSTEEISNVIERETLAGNSECLIEGTAKDKVSHFTLRFLCASDSALQEFFVQNEVKLFSYRLKFLNFLKILQMLEKASLQSESIILSNSYILSSYHRVLKSLMFVSEQVQNVTEGNESFINVPFISALKFVAERLYPLHLGFIILPVSDLKHLLIHLYHDLILQGMKQMRATLMKELEDPKMQYMLKKIKSWFHSKISCPAMLPSRRIFANSNLMNESEKFPLCMGNLYQQLLKHHRLKHHSRIQLTLFLKEVGVPAEAVIELFMKEYSMPLVKSCEMEHGMCSHNWTDSENRYIYSIEHLYGMRGACKNYRAHNCETLQNAYSNDGGCPFVTYDAHHLQKTLECQNMKVKDIEDIMSAVNQKKYNEACRLHLLLKIDIHYKDRKCVNFLDDKNESKNNACPSTQFPSSHDYCSSYFNNRLLSSNMLKKFSSPSDFYSALNYTDESLAHHCSEK